MEMDEKIESVEVTPPSDHIEDENLAAAMRCIDMLIRKQLGTARRDRFDMVKRVAEAAQNLIRAAEPKAMDFAGGAYEYGNNILHVGGRGQVIGGGMAGDGVDIVRQMVGMLQPNLEARNGEAEASARRQQAAELADLMIAMKEVPAGREFDPARAKIDKRIQVLLATLDTNEPPKPADTVWAHDPKRACGCCAKGSTDCTDYACHADASRPSWKPKPDDRPLGIVSDETQAAVGNRVVGIEMGVRGTPAQQCEACAGLCKGANKQGRCRAFTAMCGEKLDDEGAIRCRRPFGHEGLHDADRVPALTHPRLVVGSNWRQKFNHGYVVRIDRVGPDVTEGGVRYTTAAERARNGVSVSKRSDFLRDYEPMDPVFGEERPPADPDLRFRQHGDG